MSPEEQEHVIQLYSKDGYVSYMTVLDMIKGAMSKERAEMAANVFAALSKGAATISAARLQQIKVETHPGVALGGVTPAAMQQDWDEAVRLGPTEWAVLGE